MGCGWLGLPLAQALLDRNYSVKGTTTRKQRLSELRSWGITACQIRLDDKEIQGPIEEFLNGMDVLVINIPPKLRSENSENYTSKIEMLKLHLKHSDVRKILFVSSTSVYGDLRGEVVESTPARPTTESGKQLLASEQLFLQDPAFTTTVVRFGGLIGPGRHPSYQLSGRKGLKNGGDPVNLIHLDDCLSVIISIIEKGWWNTVFNAVYPAHPAKGEYYTVECLKRGLAIPEYDPISPGSEGKTVLSSGLQEKGFEYKADIQS